MCRYIARSKLASLLDQRRRWHGKHVQVEIGMMPGPRRTFVLEGVEGQRIFVDPKAKLVLVHTAVRLRPSHNPGDIELIALWRRVLAQEGRE